MTGATAPVRPLRRPAEAITNQSFPIHRPQQLAAHVLLSGLSDDGNASQNSCSGSGPGPGALLLEVPDGRGGSFRGSESDMVQMMSAVVLRAGSNPLAQPPTTRQMPSGLTPHLRVVERKWGAGGGLKGGGQGGEGGRVLRHPGLGSGP